jgi:hypothetical protein
MSAVAIMLPNENKNQEFWKKKGDNIRYIISILYGNNIISIKERKVLFEDPVIERLFLKNDEINGDFQDVIDRLLYLLRNI